MIQHLRLPAPPWPEAARLLERYQQAARKRSEAGGAIAALDRQTHAVKQADMEAHAEALLAGKSRPPDQLTKHEARIARKRAELQPLELNRERAAEAFLEHIEAHLREYRQVVIDRLADLGSQPLTLDTVEQIEQMLAWRAWVDRFPRKSHTMLPVHLSVGVRGERVAVKEVLNAVSHAVTEATQTEASDEQVGASA